MAEKKAGRKRGRPSMLDTYRKSSGKQLSLTNGQWKALEEAAEGLAWSKSDIVRCALANYLPGRIRLGMKKIEGIVANENEMENPDVSKIADCRKRRAALEEAMKYLNYF